MTNQTTDKKRKRASSQRSIETRNRILDAAEQLFADRGFDGASIRDIAQYANVQKAAVNFHGGPKDRLFATVVARRAAPLAQARIEALEQVLKQPTCTDPASALRAVLAAFIHPLLDKAAHGGAQWLAYARLVAQVSADPTWRELAHEWFDPTAARFLDAIMEIYPRADRQAVAAGFVFSVSAMLSLCTSQWRIAALSGPDGAAMDADHLTRQMIQFCAAGMQQVLQ